MSESIQHMADELPEPLRERTRVRTGGSTEPGERVVYWMRNAARGHDNPALEVCLHLAELLDQPPLVLQTVTSMYPYASDRHHLFQLQGARDVAGELEDRGIPYALFVQTAQDQLPLQKVVRESALLVVEELHVKPFSHWGPALGDAAGTPVLSVDTDCIVPVTLPDAYHDRAYKFRNATEEAREDRIDHTWTNRSPDRTDANVDQLPFDPVEPRSADLLDLIQRCDIDHGVGPVPHRTGGSDAGYRRWNAFREDGLNTYHQRRNDPAQPEAVSRLSPYLHYGHVSPFRVARDAYEQEGDGPDKFIDELITWRELAHHYCFHHDDYNRFSGLPEWAQKTLNKYRGDDRDTVYDWDTLARARTGDRLWDLCQQSLLTHGELHNNVRMTWAKQLLRWTETPERALRIAIDLNNRYALDGRDPNSYGGILWCFGLFDRPYDTDREVIGQVRPRTTDWHADRLDLDGLETHVQRPLTEPGLSVGVVGAGIAGSTAARILRNHGVSVDVYEKSRGSGGRCSTRRVERDDGPWFYFDHGAQYFTARSPVFRRFVQSALRRGDVSAWSPDLGALEDGDITPVQSDTRRFVGVPGNSTLADVLLDDVSPSYDRRVQSVRSNADALTLTDEDGMDEEYDAVVVTAPPKQTADMIETDCPALAERCREVHMVPVWALLIGFDASVPVDRDAVFLDTDVLGWTARNSSKPGRSGGESWVVHATSAWTSGHLEIDSEAVAEQLLDEWRACLDLSADVEPVYAQAHRWRYARAEVPADRMVLQSSDGSVVVAGDWLTENRIEGAFRSGRVAAGRVFHELARRGEGRGL